MATGRKDIALDDDNDLKIVGGDFSIELSDQQHVQIIFKTHMGEFKEWPLLGFGADNYLKKTGITKAEFLRDLKVQLEYDGYPDADIDLDKGIEKLTIKV